MEMRRISILLMMLVIIMINPPCILDSSMARGRADQGIHIDEQINHLAYIPHDPIFIYEDEDFSFFPGSGSASDPYIIENLIFSTTNYCIYIQDVNVHFAIRGCYFTVPAEESTWYPAVFITNSNHGYFENNTFQERTNGIETSALEAIEVVNCSFVDSDWHWGRSLSLNSGTTAVVMNCMFDLSDDAIDISFFGSVSISGNLFSSDGEYNNLVSVTHCDDSMIANNSFILTDRYDSYSWAIRVYSGVSLTILNNSISGGSTGIRIQRCEDGLVQSNSVSGNSYGSLYLYQSSKIQIINNFLESGVRIYGEHEKHWCHYFLNNYAYGRPIGYFANQTSLLLNQEIYSQILVISCWNTTVENLTFEGISGSITIAFSDVCLVNNAEISSSPGCGMSVHKSRNIRIQNCRFSDCNEEGLYMSSSSDIVIESNDFDCNIRGDRIRHLLIANNSLKKSSGSIYSWYASIELSEIEDAIICSNTLHSISVYGLFFSRIEENIITGSSNSYTSGISIDLGSHVSISSNAIDDVNNVGISIDSASEFLVKSNIISRCKKGMLLEYSRRIMIERNNFFDCDEDGLYLMNCYLTNITKNVVWGNGGYGVQIRSRSEDLNIFYNEIGYNSGGNAIDDGFNNLWDDGVGLGNYWSDSTGSGAYEISGLAESVDRFPKSIGSSREHAPLTDSPDDMRCDLSSNPRIVLEWDAWDSDPSFYTIHIDGVMYTNMTWDGSEVSVDLSHLQGGTYTITLLLRDQKHLTASDSVTLTLFGIRPTETQMSLSTIEIAYLGVLGVEISIVAILVLVIVKKRHSAAILNPG